VAREPLSPAKQKRLQKVFEHAVKKAEAASSPNDFDYVTDLLIQCVGGDPSNAIYIRAFLENLQKKYGNNRKGGPLAQFKERGARGTLKKALAQENWDEVIHQGLKVLVVNPWDLSVLIPMAKAASKSGDFDCELCYLKTALTGAPKDPKCNRLFAIALSERGLLDQAITFWRRVEEALPDNEEAKRAMSVLTVQKARSTGKFDEDDETTRKLRVRAQQQEDVTFEDRLRKKIQGDPENISLYMELAQFYITEERYHDAERQFEKAYELSNGDLDIREKWDDSQLRHLRQKITRAHDPATKKKLQNEYFQKDVTVCKNRVERYPNNLAFKYDLGYRYMKTKQYAEAIRELQGAKNDPRRKGSCMLLLGECFQLIKQYRLAMSHYTEAIQEIPDRDADNKRKSLYLAGRLALALKDLDVAEKHLTNLAGLDFTYKDVSKLLDKIAKLRENPESATVQESESTEPRADKDE